MGDLTSSSSLFLTKYPRNDKIIQTLGDDIRAMQGSSLQQLLFAEFHLQVKQTFIDNYNVNKKAERLEEVEAKGRADRWMIA